MTDIYNQPYTLADIQAPATTQVSLDNIYTNQEEIDQSNKLALLEKRKQEKLAKLSNFTSLDDSYTQLENGTLESNQNKIWNELSDQEFYSTFQYGLDNYGLTPDAEGNLSFASGETYNGPTKRLYLFGTKDSESPAVKLGLAGGFTKGSEERYTPNELTGYGWESGGLGVDTQRKELDVLLPEKVAIMLEGLGHGRRQALEHRVAKDSYSDSDTKDLLGSGFSEYYTDRASLLGDYTQFDRGLGEQFFNQYANEFGATSATNADDLRTIQRQNQEYLADTATVADRIANTAKGFAATFVNELLINPLEAVGDITGAYDLGDAENAVTEFSGYNPVMAERAMENIGNQLNIALSDDATVAEKTRAIGNGIIEAFTTPEMLGTSFGALAAWMLPGTAATKLLKVGSKFNKVVKVIDEAVEAGKISALAGKAEKTKRLFTTVPGFKQMLAKQSGMMTAALGNVNNQYEEFVQNNNGKELEGADKAQWLAGRFAVQIVNQNLDKFVDLEVIKAPGMFKAIVPALRSMTNKEFSAVVKQMAKGVAVSAADASSEAAQEYTQTMMELYNSRYGSELFKDQDTFKEFLADKRNLTEAGVAAIAGFGGAPQFELAGSVGSYLGGTAALVGGAGKFVQDKLPAKNQPKTSLTDAENGAPAATTEDELKTAKQQYAALLQQLKDDTFNGKVTTENLGRYLDTVDEINRTKHVIETSPVEQIKLGEDVYNSVLDQLETFINENSETALTKRLVRKTVQESKQDKEEREAYSGVTPEVKQAFQAYDNLDKETPRSEYKAISATISEIEKAATVDDLADDINVVVPALQVLEKALTGEVSTDAATTFTKVKEYLAQNDLKTVVPADQQAAPSTVVINEEQTYTPQAQAAEAERIVATLLGSHRSYDADFTAKVFQFAKKNGISEKRLEHLRKSYETVEEEAVQGPRGYLPRLAKLRGLVESSNPNQKALETEAQGITSFQAALSSSVTQLERGIKAAELEAAKRNKQKLTTTKAKEIKTEYTKNDGTKFTIWVSQKNGKWVAQTSEAKVLLDKKKQYVKDIDNELREIAARDSSLNNSNIINTRTLRIPTVQGQNNEYRKKDKTFFERAGKLLKELGLTSNVTAVIRDENHTKKWDARGDYHKANSLLLNNEEYTADDVVLVNANGVRQNRKKTFALNTLIRGESVPTDQLTDAQKSFRAAIDAGASIILDSDLSDKARQSLHQYLVKSKGYVHLDGYNGSVLVKATAENKQFLAEKKAFLAKEKQQKEAIAKHKEDLIAKLLGKKYNTDPQTGKELGTVDLQKLETEITDLRQIVLQESFDNNSEKLDAFIERRLQSDVQEAAKEHLAEGERATPLNFVNNKGLEKGVIQFIEQELSDKEKSAKVLSDWKQFVEEQQLRGQEREAGIAKLLSAIGAIPKMFSEMIKERSFAIGQNDVFEEVYYIPAKDTTVTKVVRKELSAEEIAKYKTEGRVLSNAQHGLKRTKHVLLDVRRVSQNPFKLVQLTKTTVINSLPLASLPFALQHNVEAFIKKVSRSLEKMQAAELADKIDTRVDNGYLDGNFNLHNSPSRGLIFGKDGNVNETVLAAMYVSIGDMLKTDLGKLTRGYKTDADIALMFNIQEYEVTKEMRDHVKEHGAFLKTVANSLGKSVLTQLGFTKTSKDVNKDEYAALIADIGNATLAIAEQQGLIALTNEKSDDLAHLFRDGKPINTDAVTHFVHVVDREEKVGKYTRKVPTKAVTAFMEQFEDVAKEFPESSTTRKEPTFKKPTAEQLEKAKTEVHNDIFGKAIPAAAQKTLEHLMNTAYEANLERINEFLDAVAASGSRVKEHLGYIEIDSDKYKSLYAGDKEVQEAKNRAIDKTIEELTKLKEILDAKQAAGEKDIQLFFEYFYSGNDRYMMDSNTINPQVDKIVRFLVVPAAHRLEYNVQQNPNGKGLLFDVNGEDQSYMVRMAIAQGFGQGVDKLSADNIIKYSDAMLGLSLDQLETVRQQLLNENEYKIQVKETGDIFTIKADHITHALQTIDFLKQVQQTREGKGTFTSALSLEFDSLTSGFANKIQQMPILNNMREHLARTGILTKEHQEWLKERGFNFDPANGDSVATILEKGKEIGFYDSYQSMANTTTDILSLGEVQQTNLTSTHQGTRSGIGVYEAIKSLLPGSELVEEKQTYRGEEDAKFDIGKSLRNLFKPPFMIFNYSASINRIVKNLGFEVSTDLAQQIVKADLTKDTEIKTVITNLLASAPLFYPKVNKTDKDIPINTAEELQEALKEYTLSQIRLQKPFKVDNRETSQNKGASSYAKNLEALLAEIVTLTYGETIRSVFESEFAPFVAVQDAMNDTYKVAFRIFDQKRVEKLKNLRLTNENHILTEEDHIKVLEELWNDFPWIIGPLTGAKNKEGVRDAIIVASSSVRSPQEIERARLSPQTRLGTGSTTKSRTVTPLIRYMEEAVSAGSVLPFHAIDGAEMSYLINSMFIDLGIEGLAAIHDAILAPLNAADHATFRYQEGMQKINTGKDKEIGFNLASAINGLITRIEKSLNDKDFERDYKELSVKGLKASETSEKGNAAEKFPQVARKAIDEMKKQISIIESAREEYYNEENGLMKGAWYGNMVGTPASMYQEGMSEPISYKEAFKNKYQTVTINDEIIEEESKVEIAKLSEMQKNDVDTANSIDDINKGCSL